MNREEWERMQAEYLRQRADSELRAMGITSLAYRDPLTGERYIVTIPPPPKTIWQIFGPSGRYLDAEEEGGE